MSDETAVGRIAILQETLDGALRQLQITQQVVEQLRLSMLALTGGKLHPVPAPKSTEDGTPLVEINVPVQPLLIRYNAVVPVQKSKIATL